MSATFINLGFSPENSVRPDGGTVWFRPPPKALRGWKNKDLAKHLGVSEAYMSGMMRGIRDVKLSMLDRMKKSLGVTTLDLFGRETRIERAARTIRSRIYSMQQHLRELPVQERMKALLNGFQ